MLQAQLVEPDRSPESPDVKAYRDSGSRDRLNAFAERGLDNILTEILPQNVWSNLIISDVWSCRVTQPFDDYFFTLKPHLTQLVVIANLLFDPGTLKVTGLVDYDCSHIGHPLYRYFFSPFLVKYYVVSAEPEIASAIFHQHPSPLPQSEPMSGPEAADDDPPQCKLIHKRERESWPVSEPPDQATSLGRKKSPRFTRS